MSALFVADLFEIRPYGDIIYRIGADHFDAQKILHDHQADLKQTDKPRSLRIQTNATYGGMGINGRLYPDGQIRQGSPSWIKDYPKPFLLHHKSGTGRFDPVDPIGRHRGYRFQSFMPGGKDSQDDTLKEGGTSVLNTEADIVDPDSIQKIIDGRYKTTSVGFTMASANCTICEKDWKAEGPCEHVPNRVYESKNHRDSKKTIQKICLLRCSGIKYQEQSFVNVPAAPLAGITSFKNINDALERMDVARVVVNRQDKPQYLSIGPDEFIYWQDADDVLQGAENLRGLVDEALEKNIASFFFHSLNFGISGSS